MNLFGPKKLKGTLTFPDSGIAVTLPDDYTAYDIQGTMFLIGARKEYGALMFSTENIIMIENGPLINPFTQAEEEPEITMEGDFQTYTMSGKNEKEWIKGWLTYSNKYRISFIYFCKHEDKQKEIPRISEIIATLQIPPGS